MRPHAARPRLPLSTLAASLALAVAQAIGVSGSALLAEGAADAPPASPAAAAAPASGITGEKLTALWPLTYYLSSRLPTDTSPASRSSRFDELVTGLKAVYGVDSVVAAGGGNLLLRGTAEELNEMKSFLARIDSPWPQVQMTLWALQLSGRPETIGSQLERLADDVRDTREGMLEVQKELARIARRGGLKGCAAKLEREVACGRSPVHIPIASPLSLNESLVLLALSEDRQQKVVTLREWLQETSPDRLPATEGYRAFHRLERAFVLERPFVAGSVDPDCEAFRNFLRALRGIEDRKEGAPEAVVRTGMILDRVLKEAMDAYAADMEELFLDPLLQRARSSTGERQSTRKGEGVSLIGRSRIVVTSGLTSGLTPEMSSPVEISRPAAFTTALLDQAFPTKKEGDPAATGAQRIFQSLSQPEALLLAAALSEPEVRFAKVAPGIEVKVRPTVLPDGSSARLTIDASFGVTTTPIDPATTDSRNEPPAPAIEKHHVQTDAAVGVFDLFDISSFSMTTSHPRAPYFLPILGRLPILGPAFQWPRRPKVVHHESVILVNTVVLPRALTLSSFYRLADFERETSPRECK